MTVESLQSSRVLVVEDESLIAEEIKDRLERMGVNVVAMVTSGEDAVLRAGELHPNIILMDIRLRGSIDGIEAAQRIATLHQIPVVYLTAHADDATLARAKRTAPYGYLLKPFAERDLRIVLEMALYKHSTEAQLHQSRELYATTLAGIIEGVIAADENACITFMNPAAERMTQWTAKEATGRPVKEVANVVHSKTHENVHDMTGHVLITGEPLLLDDVLLVARNGSEMSVFDSVSPIRNAENHVKGVVLVLRDLTEQKRLNDALRDADMRMQRMQKMDAIGRLAGGIAHDVGNMMMIVRGNGELLLEQHPMNDSVRTRVEGMLHAADRSSALARQLLAFSRKQSFTTLPVDLNEAVEGMRPMLHALLGPEIHIESNLNKRVAPIMADRAQIEQILMNLSINSRDAMPRGGTLKFETSFVAVKDESAGGLKPGMYSMLTVTDTGGGMSDEVKAHLFEPFFTTKGVGKGTGMGLATVFGIVAQFNGHIDISSTIGRGTSVRLHFPAIEHSDRKGLVSGSTNTIPTTTVLLVEDEPELRELVVEFLKSQNYRVITAENGEEALDLAQKEAGSIELLLTDAMMPRMSGVMLAEKLGTLRPNTKVIFMSGYTEDCLTDRSSLKGGMAFIQKPFSKGDLLRKVADMLRVNK